MRNNNDDGELRVANSCGGPWVGQGKKSGAGRGSLEPGQVHLFLSLLANGSNCLRTRLEFCWTMIIILDRQMFLLGKSLPLFPLNFIQAPAA